ncbi:monovalent cation/H+ antiporter subunit D [Nitrospira sp. Nam80]
MNHLLVAPIVLPALMAALLLILQRAPLAAARVLSVAVTGCLLAVALAILGLARPGSPLVYELGNWPAPFGIVLVADRLSALMLSLTALLGLTVALYATQGWDARGRFFHPLFLFQLMGLNGAFLTGDLFNLFVFFEVLLIASYCLALHGLGRDRLRATLHYAAINIAASSVFLIAVSLLYGVTGTLNMAHLAERVAQVQAEDIALVRAAGLLLFGVFGVKAALFPLHFWLPPAYAHAPAPVAALFSIMTKVGIYAIIRVKTLIYGLDAGTLMDLTSPWLLPCALGTLTLATVGALGADRLATMTAYLTMASTGTILSAVAVGGAPALSAALYYLAHSTVVIAVLFLNGDLLGRSRGDLGDSLHPGPEIRKAGWLGLAFLFGGATVAGVPPSAGFFGKVLVLQSTQDGAAVAALWGVVLMTSVLTLVACARAGSIVLWNVTEPLPAAQAHVPRGGEWAALITLIVGSLLLVVYAAPITSYLDETAADLIAPARYIDAVLGSHDDNLIRPFVDGGR